MMPHLLTLSIRVHFWQEIDRGSRAMTTTTTMTLPTVMNELWRGTGAAATAAAAAAQPESPPPTRRFTTSLTLTLTTFQRQRREVLLTGFAQTR